ncbi:hypothetical protein Aconfl_17770 [Algoriphagus confluentis]|uniref:CHAD domain-containing protein n=2 Tax=Algoriphagus confluentis TaxID=1697556 RepID=A0ABQ6PMD7_9BACT|nr:hypothetical protein Aconfl_17770 [Algoriphagus confluentis]
MLSPTDTKESIRDFFLIRQTRLSFMLRYSRRKFSQSAFHRFRVEIKKLKAVLAVLEEESVEFSRKKTYAPIKKLYAQAGRVRELQIEKELILSQIQANQLPEFCRRMNTEIQQERDSFFEIRTWKARKKAEQSLGKIAKEIEKLKKINWLPTIQTSRKRIKALIQESIGPENAHELRIQLKLSKNALEMQGFPALQQADPQEEELMKLLGDWHDLEVLAQRMSPSPWAGTLPAPEKKILEKVIQTLSLQKSRLLSEIQSKAPSLLT